MSNVYWVKEGGNLDKRKQIFVVAIEVPNYLEAKVVSNFVDMAIKKFDKLARKNDRLGCSFFEGLGATPKYQIAEIDLSMKDNAIRDLIFIIKSIRDGNRDNMFSEILY